jgi:hypothetical protein
MTPSTSAASRGATRLCHFTPALNLPHMLRDGEIRPTSAMTADARACFNATDLLRLDGHPGSVCCSIQYPNGFYLARARQSGRLQHFPDWIVLLLPLALMDREGALFSPRNAAAGSGAYLQSGEAALDRCYAPAVAGTGGNTFTRGPNHLPGCPTDQQAEVLVPGAIPIGEVQGIVVASPSQARAELSRLRAAGLSIGDIPLIVSPTFFDRNMLSTSIRGGSRPVELLWEDEDE